MDPTSELRNVSTMSPSPPEVMSKSSTISQSETKLTDSGLRRETSGPLPQGRPSNTTMPRDALSDERIVSPTGANPAAALRQPSQESRLADNQTTAIPATVSSDRQATAQRGDIGK